MSRPPGGFRGWLDDPLRDPATAAEQVDDEPLERYYQQRAGDVRRRLAEDAPTDPRLLARLQRDLAAWERAIAAETVADHWASGEGDRKLF